MLAWKMAPLLAAGNCVVLKPAQVTPMTALKFAELAAKAGFPKGVINIVPGSGSVVGQRICDHPDIRKVGFTGSTPIGAGIMKRFIKEPIGVCGLIVPWNYPLMMLAWKMAPLLAAGNCVVLKPAQVTPMTALKFAELAAKAGFPKGVINIVPGSGSVVGQRICDHPDIRKVGFTGSTPIGAGIMKSAAASNVKRVSLELGGKSPLIIFSDCDMEKAVRQGMYSCMFNKGENCIAAGRLYIEESIHDEFVTKVIEEIKKMKIGDPLDRSTDHGPQNHKAHMQSLLHYIEAGIKDGAKLVYGGKRLDRKGFFLQPAVFTDVTDDMFIAKEESFGPVINTEHW
eukprot:Seg1176.1 transcript_id=Seg1176.1/GoldUCD/mRNA.D3Y31 product="Cytosolic 10-formyltetrahydrofolate dehydrogenase" protein_id=Seg1176.1/GoldUCD/D3Y31